MASFFLSVDEHLCADWMWGGEWRFARRPQGAPRPRGRAAAQGGGADGGTPAHTPFRRAVEKVRNVRTPEVRLREIFASKGNLDLYPLQPTAPSRRSVETTCPFARWRRQLDIPKFGPEVRQSVRSISRHFWAKFGNLELTPPTRQGARQFHVVDDERLRPL